jgi:6-phosphofructokinase
VRRVGILTAGGDTPALNATIFGAVERANQLHLEMYGFLRGFSGVIDKRVPHVHLNPLFSTIPELDPSVGGTCLGASRTYIGDSSSDRLEDVKANLGGLKIDALMCIGGDGTINGMQPIAEFLPCVLAPKTIDNDLGLNYLDEPNEWIRTEDSATGEAEFSRESGRKSICLDEIINYATPGFATAVFVVAQGVQRIRTTAESHRRIAIIEVMGRQSGYIALGASYGQPDIILMPEVPIDMGKLERRVRELYDIQKHVVIVVGEGVRDETGVPLGDTESSVDPAGNVLYRGAAEALKRRLAKRLGEELFKRRRKHEDPASVLFTRKIGHTQRGGRPIRFDRFYASQLGGKAIDLLIEGKNNTMATLQWSQTSGFVLDSISANKLRDRWRAIHPRVVHTSLFDEDRFQPSALGVEYLKTIFTNAIGTDDTEHLCSNLFSPGNLATRYQSVNIDIQKRVRYGK